MNMGKVLLMMLTTGPAFAFASDGVFGDAAGMARAQKIDLREISVDGGPVMLNAAYCFQVWNGPRPDYPSGEGGDLANLREYLEQQGDSARLAHLDWIVDFAIRFDQDVAKGDVALYGQLDPLFPNWVNFNEISGIPALKANEEFRLLNVDFITYGMALEMLENFNCGASSRLYGTTITVELKLYDPTGAAEPLTIASCRHTFALENRGNWFDAHIAEYCLWPEDVVWAFGGSWSASEPLDRAATVMREGELDVCTKDGLAFVADEARTVGDNPDETVIETEVLMEECAVTNLPSVASSCKGGVLVAEEDGLCWYYGLAKVGARNEWVRLDGPGADPDGDSVHLKMTFRKVAGETLSSMSSMESNTNMRDVLRFPLS
ncbi:MAG: hypothetical protein KBT68_12260 [bacterium]|nr:hypothetical protein [Candidatus Colisoma equi]